MRSHPHFNEKWLQEQIGAKPSLLGLGDLDLRDMERRQPRAGRLDMLLQDPESNTRYEVELQLGGTDESHIVRTIEYWDLERRRYPQYEHVAVIVAEDITARFFNVISLFNGFIPIIAIQVEAIRVGEAVTLVFTRVLDQMHVGFEDDEDEADPRDRSYWETNRGSPESLALLDQLLQLVRTVQTGIEPKYNKNYIGLTRNGVVSNFVSFRPRKSHIIMEFKCTRDDALTAQIEEAGLDLLARDRWSDYRLALRADDIVSERDLLIEMIELSNAAYSGS